MLHFFLGLFLSSFILSGYAWAKCEESETTVVIPMMNDEKTACYRQSHGLSMKAEKVKDGEYVEFEIAPLSIDFENIPSATTHQYLNIEYDAENKPSKILIASFVCSGETPLGGDAFSEALGKDGTSSIDVFIATGQAAENVAINQMKKAKAKVFDTFLELFESRSPDDIESSNIYVPNVIAGMSGSEISSLTKKHYSSFFSRTNSSINGCSKLFLAKMQDLLIENVSRNQPYRGIEIKKKRFSTKYKMKWTL